MMRERNIVLLVSTNPTIKKNMKTKAQLIEKLKKIVDNSTFKCVAIDNVFINDAGETHQLIDLCYDDNELGVTLADWFYPINELTKTELISIYKSVAFNN